MMTDRNNTTVTPTMRAIAQHRYGTTGTLEYVEAGRPEIAPDEVLIEVHAAGVDRGVWHLMTGLPYLVRLSGFGLTKPKTPVLGLDVAGRVVAIGSGVMRFSVGDEVFGIANGSYAEYAAANESKLAHKPARLSFEQAAVTAISGGTALQALTDAGRIGPGQRVLVIGASGGVGSFAVQIAGALGAKVTGVASKDKADLVEAFGAERVFDYATDPYLDGSERYDLIIDTGGLTPVRRLKRALTQNGTLVIVGGEGGGRWTGGIGRQLRASLWSLLLPQRLKALVSREHHTYLERLAVHLERGAVVPAIGRRYRLEEVPAAIDDLAAGRASGKSVVVVRHDP